MDKIQLYENEIQTDDSLIQPSETTIPNCFDITLKNEDYTLGKILEFLLFTKFYGKTLTFCGFNKPHPHNPDSIIRLGFKKQTEIPEIVSHNDIMIVKNNFKNEEDLTDKYNYFEWDKIKFLNKNSQIMQAYSLYNISSPVFSLCLPIFLLILPFFLIKLQGYPLSWSQYSTYLQIVLRNHSLGQIFNIKSASWDKRVMINFYSNRLIVTYFYSLVNISQFPKIIQISVDISGIFSYEAVSFFKSI